MRLVLLASTTLATMAALPAYAQGSLRNTSEASKQVITASGAIGESGIKASAGVVAIPLGGVALASGAVGAAANASGYAEVGSTFEDGGAGVTKGARSLVEFSGEPLTVSDEVVIGRPQEPVAQPAPNVPYAPGQQ